MSDYIWTRVTFGGTVKRSDLPKIVDEMIDSAGEWEGGEYEELETAAREHRCAVALNAETAGGMADELCGLLTGLGLSWKRQSDARYEFDGQITVYDPETATERESQAGADGSDAVISLSSLKRDAEKGKTLADVISELAWTEADPPPLVIVEG